MEGGWTAKNFFWWVEVLFITDFRRLGGERNYVFHWVVGLFSVLFMQNKKIIREWIKLSFFLSGFLYQLPICMTVSPQRHIHEWCQLPGSFTEEFHFRLMRCYFSTNLMVAILYSFYRRSDCVKRKSAK